MTSSLASYGWLPSPTRRWMWGSSKLKEAKWGESTTNKRRARCQSTNKTAPWQRKALSKTEKVLLHTHSFTSRPTLRRQTGMMITRMSCYFINNIIREYVAVRYSPFPYILLLTYSRNILRDLENFMIIKSEVWYLHAQGVPHSPKLSASNLWTSTSHF